jgi:hypothetical protein
LKHEIRVIIGVVGNTWFSNTRIHKNNNRSCSNINNNSDKNSSGNRSKCSRYTLVCTRANFDTSTSSLLPNHKKTDYAATDVPGLQVGTCPAEIVIFVHGVGATQSDAIEQTERVKMSLNSNGYYNPVIGFSWDPNVHNGGDIKRLTRRGESDYRQGI